MPRSIPPRPDKSRFIPMDGRSRGRFDARLDLDSLFERGIGPAPTPFTSGVGSGVATAAASQLPFPGPVHIDEDLLFLIKRATHGFSIPAYEEARTMGYQAWLEWQLDYENIDDTEVDAALAGFQTLDLSNNQLYETFIDDASPVVFELQQALLLRSIYSRKQLFERMVDFWTYHFNINQLDDLALWWKTSDDKRVIRRFALGTFPEMLRASARSSCMMWYLDNYINQAGAVQENWARELMELHTLGVDGPYTEDDVREVARCFTGWTFHGVFTAGPIGLRAYVDAVHDQGAKTVLGVPIPANGGEADGEMVLDILANHPATANFISYKMSRFLLGYEPPTTLVERVSNVYMTTGGDIKSMVREILRPPSVAMVPEHRRPKIKRPFEVAVGAMRALGIESTNLLNITAELQGLGLVPFWWPSPDGPPDEVEAWGQALLPRWDFNSRITKQLIGGNAAPITQLEALVNAAPASYTTLAEKVSFVLHGERLRPAELNAIQAFYDGQPSTNIVLREVFELVASSESAQYF